MSFEWPLVRLENVTSRIGDGLHGTPKYDDNGDYYFINGNNLSNGRIVINEKTKRTDEEQYLKHKKDLNDRTILVSINGTLGNIATYREEKIILGKSACYLNVLPGVDKDYIKYVLTSKHFQDYIHNLATGSTIKNVGLKLIREYEFRLPELAVQKKVSNILKVIDLKIENNTKTNQTLEQIAQAIFKSWFVDFDPVKAKIETLAAGGSADDAELAAISVISAKTLDELNGLKASNLEAFNKLAQTAALFPAAMQDTELGEIPEGWEISDLASCTTELRRGISPKYIEEGGVLVINQKCIRNHTIDFSLARRNDSSKRKVDGREIVIGDVLVNSTGVGTLGRLAPIRFLNETTVADSHVTVVRANTTKISKSFLAGLMLTSEAYIEASGAGSTGQTELRKQVLEDIKFAKPSNAVDKFFDEIVGNFNAQIAELEKQRVTLSLTRDALLPKLLFGELVGE